MEHRTLSVVTLSALCCLTVMVAVAAGQLYGLGSDITTLLRQRDLQRGIDMQTLETTAVSRDGISAKITTTQIEDETLDQFIARHRAAVLAWQQAGA